MEKVKDYHVPDLAHRHQDSTPGFLLADSVQGLLPGNAIDLLEDYVLGLLHADSVPGLLIDTILKSMQGSIVLSVFGMKQKD